MKNLLPKIKKCPHCFAVNIMKINGVNYDNTFQSLTDWKLKKKINCRKCKIQLGLFVNDFNKEEKLIWIDFFNCEDSYLTRLSKLEKDKFKYQQKNKKEYFKIIKEIQSIQNKIRLEQVRIKIKTKIENHQRGLLI